MPHDDTWHRLPSLSEPPETLSRGLRGRLGAHGDHGTWSVRPLVPVRTETSPTQHRKISGDPGWGDREIRSAPLDWDADGYPVVRLGGPSGGTSPARGTGSSPGLSGGGSSDGLGRVA